MVKSYLRAVRRRWSIIPVALLVALAALFLATHSSVTVTSRVVVPFPGDQNDVNFQGIAQSLTVAKTVARDLHIKGESAEKLLEQVSVTQEYGTNIYDVSVRDTSKARALIICDDWVSATNALYDKLNSAPATLAYSNAVQQLTATQQQITSLQQQITAFEYAHPELVNVATTTQTTGSATVSQSRGSNRTGTQTGSTSSTQTNHTQGTVQDAQYLTNLESELASQQTMYAQLAQAVGNTQSLALQSTQRTNAQVLDPAALAPSNIPLLIALTVLLGLLLGLGVIFSWEYFDRSLHTSTPLENAFGTLAVVTVAARPSPRELRQVAPASWARAALPAAPAASRPGHWPTGTTVLATIAAALPQPRPPSSGADDPADDPRAPSTNNHHNGHQPTAHADLGTLDTYAKPHPSDASDQRPAGGHPS